MSFQIDISTEADDQLAAIVTADRAGIIRAWNSAAARIFGYTEREAIGQTIDLIVPPEERGDHWHNYRRVIDSNLINYSPDHILDVEGLRKDGTRVHLDAMLIACHDKNGRIIAITATLREAP